MAGLGPSLAYADPNPRDPGYCGARQDALDCVPYDGPAPPPPTGQSRPTENFPELVL
jgi:hypothetical protein